MTHTCPGCKSLPTMSRVWHGAYRRWHRSDLAGHRVRAFAWGKFADAIVNHA